MIRIEWSDEAIGEIRAKYGEDATVWKLVSDTEGCGCAMNGVPALWGIRAPAQGELKAESNAFDVWYEQRHEVFFEERLRLTYRSDTRAFALISDSQIYSNRLRLEDRRAATVDA
ncbi:iron-sulfur cluster biosynthesis family protein [Cohnella suwonensis]|uniref:Iron-sulfur cluster biosynthesis family protein n=1 Tax=Cohnella suwonensis TaxID=696072 RepID=A0ABW0LP42_9BACL